MIQMEPGFMKYFGEQGAFDRIMALDGQEFRSLEGRRTLRFELGGRGFFAKLHRGVGWKEIFKNLLQLRLPVLGAQNEWRAIRRLEELGVETMTAVAYGRRGWNPARLESFVVTEELSETVSLEDFCRTWRQTPPPAALKRALIEKVGGIARLLHENGVNHRDFYLCHFLLQLSGGTTVPAVPLRTYLIDLHRVQLRRRTPRRWVVKDLSGLFFSALDIGLTSRDVCRFLRAYRGRPLREVLGGERPFWRRVRQRAVALYRKDFRRNPVLPGACIRAEEK